MKKLILPALTAVSVLVSGTATAQYHDPFFDSMLFAPHKIETAQFSVEPRMNVADLKDKIEIKAELAGLNENDINLTCKNGILTLSGERKQEVEEQNTDYYLKEMSAGAFSRSIRLPENIDESKIEAVFKNGVLTITIPKTEKTTEDIKKIPIKKAE